MRNFTKGILFALLIAVSTFTKAQIISRDSSFNVNGSMLFQFYGNIDRGFDCAVQQDQKMLLVGLSKNTGTNYFEMCIARFNTDGSFDTTFSHDGKAYVSMGNQSSIGGILPSIKIDANQKIVVAGSGRGQSSQDFLIARLNPNGTPDLTFNGTGSKFIDILGTNTQPDAAAAFNFDAAGNIYLAGVVGVSPPIDNELAVVKLTSTGAFDNSFDLDGKQYYNLGAGNEFGEGICVLSNGNILVGLNAGVNMALLCLYPSGNLASSFGNSGYTSITFSGNSSLEDLKIDNAGRIVVCGIVTGSGATGDNIGVARYLSNGTPDPNFASNGKFESDLSGSDDNMYALSILPNNKILLAGSGNYSATADDFIVAQLDSNGTTDNTFNNSTWYYKMNSAYPASSESFKGISLLSNGTILAVGTVVFSSAVNEHVFIARLKNSAPLSVTRVSEEAKLIMAPNPFFQSIAIESKSNTTLQLLDAKGSLLKTLTILKGKNSISLDEFHPGLYFIMDTQSGLTQKLVKMND